MKLVLGLLAFLFIGCYQTEQNLPPSIFEQVKQVQRPEIKSVEDIQKSYIYLFEAYESNLNLLKLLENASKK